MRRMSWIPIAVGVLIVAWTVVTWRWQDPLTAVETWHAQRQLSQELRARAAGGAAPIAERARSYRLSSLDGEAMGRLVIPRLGLDDVLVDGTSPSDLAKGPGIYAGDFLPGEGRLVYVAGHRTTHGAPFADLNELRPGDSITIRMPYGSFRYVVTGHRIVEANDIAVLRSHVREQLILQTCHPRFSATHRYLVYATPERRRTRSASLISGATTRFLPRRFAS